MSMTKSQMYAIYYKNQTKKYADYEKRINELGLRNQFESFRNNYKGFYKNKVYYYFFKKLGI